MRLRALLVLALLACPSFAHADIVWRGDFESGDVSQWNEQLGPVEQRVSVVTDPVREGMYAARVEIRPGDLGIGDLNRVELGYHPPRASFAGSERWYAWSVMQDASAPLGASWHAFTYWEATMISTAALSFRLYAGNQMNFATLVGGETVQWESTLEPGVWHDFVLHVVWSADASEGLVELWYDAEQVVPPTSIATMFTLGDGTPLPNFLHIGMLRDDQLDVDEVFFFDGVIEATSREDLEPAASDSSGGVDATSEGSSSDAMNGSTSSTSTTSESSGSSGAPANDEAGCGCGSAAPSGLLPWLLGLAWRRRPATCRP